MPLKEEIVRELGMDMKTQIYLKWIANKDLLYSSRNSAQCYMAAWMGGEFGGGWIHMYVWLSFFAVHLKLSQALLISYTPIQNKTFFKIRIYTQLNYKVSFIFFKKQLTLENSISNPRSTVSLPLSF